MPKSEAAVSFKRKRSEDLCPLSLSSLTQYKGVEFNSRSGKWVVKFKVDGVPKTLPGKYDTDVDAAEAYDAYMRNRGKTKGLNFEQNNKPQNPNQNKTNFQQKQQKWEDKLNYQTIEKSKQFGMLETQPVAKRKKIGIKQSINVPLQNQVDYNCQNQIEYNNNNNNIIVSNLDLNNIVEPNIQYNACKPPTPTPNPSFSCKKSAISVQGDSNLESFLPPLNAHTPTPTPAEDLLKKPVPNIFTPTPAPNLSPTPTPKSVTPLSPRTPQLGSTLQQLGICLAPRKTDTEVVTFGQIVNMKLSSRENATRKFAWKGLRQLSSYVEQIINQERQFLQQCFGSNLQGDSEEEKWKNIKMWKWSFVDGQDPMLCRQCGRAISCYFGTCSGCSNYTFYCRDCTINMIQTQGACLSCQCRFNVNTLLIIYRILTDDELDLLLQTDWTQFSQQIKFNIPKEQLYQYLISKLPQSCLYQANDENQHPVYIARVDSKLLDQDEHVAHVVHEIWDEGFPIIISNCIQKSEHVCMEWTVKRIQKLIQGIYQQFWVDQVEKKDKYKKVVSTDKFFQNYMHKSKNVPRSFMKLDNFPEGFNLFHVNQECIEDILQCIPQQLINYLHPYDGAQNLATYGQPLNYVSQMDIMQHILGDLGPKIYLNAGQISNQITQSNISNKIDPFKRNFNFNFNAGNKNATINNCINNFDNCNNFNSQVVFNEGQVIENNSANNKRDDEEDFFDGENGPVTVLHTDVCDAFNLCINVNPRKMNKDEIDQKDIAGCVWDIFHAEDLLKVEQVLEQQVETIRTYLNKDQRKEIRSLGGMHWRIWQREGDAVLVPTGCVHQVRNLTSTAKFAWDFASASHVGQIFMKQQRMSELIKDGQEGKNDTLQAECTVIQAALAWQKILQQQ